MGEKAKEIFQVMVQKSKDGFNLMSLVEFIQIELDKRTELILAGSVQFLSEDGDTIPLIEAVKLIK